MAQLTSIEWTDASWNPLVAYHSDTGKRGWFCTHVSEGCRNCYAEKINQRLGNSLAYIAQNSTRIKWGTVNLDQPSRWRTPKRIFVNSMTDPFHEDVPESMIDQVFAAMALTYKMQWTEDRGNIREPRHVFQLLTKRHERMKRYIQRLLANDWIKDWFTIPVVKAAVQIAHESGAILPGNASIPVVQWFADGMPGLWLGVSVEDQKTADQRIPDLLNTPCPVRFISYEPALGPVDFATWLRMPCGVWPHNLTGHACQSCRNWKPLLHWIISGGESGPGARPAHPAWFRAVRDQCFDANVAYFLKQWGEYGPASQVSTSKPVQITRAITKDGRVSDFNREDMIKAAPDVTEWEGLRRLGKKAAGCLLDGVEHKDFPSLTVSS